SESSTIDTFGVPFTVIKGDLIRAIAVDLHHTPSNIAEARYNGKSDVWPLNFQTWSGGSKVAVALLCSFGGMVLMVITFGISSCILTYSAGLTGPCVICKSQRCAILLTKNQLYRFGMKEGLEQWLQRRRKGKKGASGGIYVCRDCAARIHRELIPVDTLSPVLKYDWVGYTQKVSRRQTSLEPVSNDQQQSFELQEQLVRSRVNKELNELFCMMPLKLPEAYIPTTARRCQ
ncbi:MAG: hypothetical protein EZS28_012825, partial [Streblomastix strix]